jgi:hypothetical protein
MACRRIVKLRRGLLLWPLVGPTRATALRASVSSTAAAAGTCGAAMVAAFYLKASPSEAGWFDLTREPFPTRCEARPSPPITLLCCHPRPVNGDQPAIQGGRLKTCPTESSRARSAGTTPSLRARSVSRAVGAWQGLAGGGVPQSLAKTLAKPATGRDMLCPAVPKPSLPPLGKDMPRESPPCRPVTRFWTAAARRASPATSGTR